jgi:hypothetical protein
MRQWLWEDGLILQDVHPEQEAYQLKPALYEFWGLFF